MAIRFHHRTGAVLTAAAACLLLGGCLRGNTASPDRSVPPVELPPGKLTGEYACSRPEASLRSPGATEIARSSRDENFTSAARCSVLYASPEDQVPIYRFYTDWAHSNGYHYTGWAKAGPTSSTSSTRNKAPFGRPPWSRLTAHERCETTASSPPSRRTREPFSSTSTSWTKPIRPTASSRDRSRRPHRPRSH